MLDYKRVMMNVRTSLWKHVKLINIDWFMVKNLKAKMTEKSIINERTETKIDCISEWRHSLEMRNFRYRCILDENYTINFNLTKKLVRGIKVHNKTL